MTAGNRWVIWNYRLYKAVLDSSHVNSCYDQQAGATKNLHVWRPDLLMLDKDIKTRVFSKQEGSSCLFFLCILHCTVKQLGALTGSHNLFQLVQ